MLLMCRDVIVLLYCHIIATQEANETLNWILMRHTN